MLIEFAIFGIGVVLVFLALLICIYCNRTRPRRWLLSIGIALCVLGLMGVIPMAIFALTQGPEDSENGVYVVYFGLRTVAYVLYGGWVLNRLHELLRETKQNSS